MESFNTAPGMFNIASKLVLTLVMVIDNEQQKILLGYKKRGFGAHLWNGFGGKVDPGETPQQGAIRELEEEAGITVRPENLRKVGLLLYVFENDPVGLETHVYKVESYEGQIRECDEMRPQWFDFVDIPFDQMWDDDKIWLPVLLEGRDHFFGRMYTKRKPIEESVPDPTTTTTTTTTTWGTTVNPSKTMTSTSFTAAQPKNGPFAVHAYHMEHLPAPPKQVALDGTIASFES